MGYAEIRGIAGTRKRAEIAGTRGETRNVRIKAAPGPGNGPNDEVPQLNRWSYRASSSSTFWRTSADIGSTADMKRAAIFPERSTRYFWKFHFTSPGKGESFVRYL